MGNVRTKRIYVEPSPEDGIRILVDRVWPRGMKKEAARIDAWMKEIAPSSGLRTWFGHAPQKWEEFRSRYLAELNEHQNELDELRERAKRGTLTLLFAARDERHNNAVVLKQILEKD